MKANTGVKKIAAIGIRVSKWIAYHGFAININNDLTKYQNIIPCGISDKGITNLKEINDQNWRYQMNIPIEDLPTSLCTASCVPADFSALRLKKSGSVI